MAKVSEDPEPYQNETDQKPWYQAKNVLFERLSQLKTKRLYSIFNHLFTHILQEENIDSSGKKDQVTKRLKQYFKRKMLVEAGIIDCVKRYVYYTSNDGYIWMGSIVYPTLVLMLLFSPFPQSFPWWLKIRNKTGGSQDMTYRFYIYKSILTSAPPPCIFYIISYRRVPEKHIYHLNTFLNIIRNGC